MGNINDDTGSDTDSDTDDATSVDNATSPLITAYCVLIGLSFLVCTGTTVEVLVPKRGANKVVAAALIDESCASGSTGRSETQF